MKKLKVLIIPSWYPDEDNPIRGIFFKEQAEALSNYADVAVLNSSPIQLNQPLQIISKRRSSIYRENGVDTFNFNYVNWIPKIPSISPVFMKRNIINGYKQVLKKWGKPDIIHAHVTYPAGYAAMILSEKYTIPFVVTEHASFFENRLMTKFNKKSTSVLKKADYYMAVSNFLRNKIVRNGRDQCKTVPNFIQSTPVEKHKQHSVSEVFHIINISSMIEIKGINYLIRAIHKIIHKFGIKLIHLHLIGDGAKMEEYKHLSEDLNLSDYCTFYGRVENYKVKEYISSSNLLVISSKSETFGVVGIEAMASGIPVVATKCGGPEDYVTEEVGILVEKENVDSLANGIMKMIDNYENYDSFKIREIFEENYSDSAVCEQIINIYKQVLQKN